MSPAPSPVTVCLRLALGRPVSPEVAVDWRAVLATAIRERLAALMWLRSADVIRAVAPPDVVDRWRTLAVLTEERGHRRLAALAEALAALEAAGVQALVLKGLPLSQRLYGNPFVRASEDIDLFIPAETRTVAAATLRASGWVRVEGEAPWDEVFVLRTPAETYLEIHEMLVSDYLAHVRVPPPGARAVIVADTTLRTLAGAVEPAYLAAHLAGHQLPPLLWGIDFLTLWGRLGEADRDDAATVARRIGLGRYLTWAIAYADSVNAAAEGSPQALTRLGVHGAERSDNHLSIIRHARLAAGARDAVSALGACVWPRPLRWDFRGLAVRVASGITQRSNRRDRTGKQRARELLRAAGGDYEPGTTVRP